MLNQNSDADIYVTKGNYYDLDSNKSYSSK